MIAGCRQSGTTEPIETPTGTIEGRVLDDNGLPVPWAVVTTEPATAQVQANVEGRYAITGIQLESASSSYVVTATNAGFTAVSGAVVLSRTQPNVVLDLSFPRVQVTLPVGSLRVRVTDLRGIPVRSAVIRLFNPFNQPIGVSDPDANGSAAFIGLFPGRYRVVVEGTGPFADVSETSFAQVVEDGEASVEVVLARFDLGVSTLDAVLSCVAPNDVIPFRVEVLNREAVELPEVAVYDTVDLRVTRPLTPQDILVDRSRFPNAVVTIDPGGGSFQVRLGALPPTGDWVEAFVVASRVRELGVWCNRATARATSPGGGSLVQVDQICVVKTLVITIPIENEDGTIGVGGVFHPEQETFRVGDGGASQPDDLVYQVKVQNGCPGGSSFQLTNVKVLDRVGVGSGILRFRELVAGFPTAGRVVEQSDQGFLWEIGTLAPGQSAELRFRAEALGPGQDVNHVQLTADQLTGTKTDEEPTDVVP